MARATPRLLPGARWTLPLAALLAFAGYTGPWLNHRAAGLAILGLDLGEYVKFLPAVQSGSLPLWRVGFYLPLVAISLTLSLYAFRPAWGFPGLLRVLMLAGAAVAALNLLPPAWTPPLLLSPEFRLQTIMLLGLGACALSSPLLGLLPRIVPALVAGALCAAAIIVPVWQFYRVLPEIEPLYGHALHAGWGLWATAVGLLLLGLAALGERRGV